ncbi:bifunctional aspartate kinase/homoserine dehydrogenase I [Roseivirga pacifica]|uniref:bifunctional aspartate kinase/homoserine dehydrogenase I n=1 Tax=Roseivirga pacifica TaxID=1267423 RepID=UPI002096569C|nr:bifunctional aspartate kinase/homoserine dehydrogenase I [Roseivirga pacifica]MCO6361008.1 bifunctional aspartate kinase/homoserine dehydrogenase I [Roseivirga pacifica]MCO6368897.1 bifunctional aspartate kinase/homoserine dehydrogenase I [Roseivirga pacifica]MCO6373040.1 bifunctional aspartate kinase/homoserine dehydrogenase I [Roseivirga pacifica]MCO6373120.1 bifunctional aspartate kinase/homoserine dehydrogenase I [Roseivirga pacifica]MCO6377623.1 bifunctional aspartate kinase/homoserine
MKVMKFGGTSVGSTDAIKQVVSIVEKAAQTSQVYVVVSAVGGVTNQLVSLSQKAAIRDKSYEEDIAQLKTQHLEIFEALTGSTTDEFIDHIFTQLTEVCKGVFLLKELTERTKDYILSSGERLSSYMVNAYMEKQGLDVQLFDAREYIITDKKFGGANVVWQPTTQNFQALKQNEKQVNLFPGFIASTLDKETATLGRGGSDYTASLIANLLKADELEIWTDVNGLMTADPRLVRQAKLLEHVSYEEALELSHFGAKVLYPPSIQPALNVNIPIAIRNTFDPEGPQTYVTKEWQDGQTIIRGISSIKDVALLTLTGPSMVGIPNFSARLFKALSDAKVNVILITQASSEHSICVGVSQADVVLAQKAVDEEFHAEVMLRKIDPVKIETDLCIVALVGSNMRDHVGISGKMFSTLGTNGVSIKAIAQGSSERNISVVIAQNHLKKALNTLHESFFLSELKKINLFVVGVGNVGKAFLSQVRKQQAMLAKEFRVDIQVVGIANSKQCYFEEQGMDLAKWPELLKTGDACNIDGFIERMKALNLRNSVFIDITASKSISAVYQGLLESSISVVTPNKIAATREMEKYLSLKWATKKYGSQFLFETNVAAGLPVISTMNDLFKSGDKVNSIQAVLSGTLNYLFNNYDGTKPFSSIVKDAKALGLTEPDPRLDLSGEDVMRKLLILIRESGRKFEMDQIAQVSFLPEACEKAKDLDEFYDLLDANEAHFQQLYADAKAEDAQLRVVASFKNGEAKVGLEKVQKSHPFYFLEGKDNIVLFYTERYDEQPLVVKGAGAGAAVTASGIFADVLRIANS